MLNKFAELFPNLASGVSGIFLPGSVNEILSIDLGRRSLKGVVLKKRGKRAHLLSVKEKELKSPAHEINEIVRELGSLLRELEPFPKHVVIVTDHVKFLASELNLPRGKKLPAERLIAAVAWEMEPYLDFPTSEALLAYQVQEDRTETDTSTVLITAMSRSTFSRLREIFKDYRLILGRTYSPECAFAFDPGIQKDAENKIIIESRHDTVVGTFLRDKDTTLFQNFPFDPEGPARKDDLKQMIYELRDPSVRMEDVEIVLAGDATSDELLEELRKELNNVRFWRPEDDFKGIKIISDVLKVGPQYATAMGAALQELGLGGKGRLGVTDRIPFGKKVKQKFYLLPVAGSALVLLCFLGHYAYMKKSINDHSSKIQKLQTERKELLELKKKREALESKEKGILRKKKYLENLPGRQKNFALAVLGISHVIPYDVVLARLSWEKHGFSIEGHALEVHSIAIFVKKLSGLESCKSVDLKSWSKKDATIGGIVLPYSFVIKVRVS